ncbi:MAG: TetR/AcrR family transcriptional regulator [Oscillospiraceae bacterium]|nr:TetR/AcrR family transcriptional regulator [Oscillospiraceae bacterium]MBQ8922937.1 TetR/AcrR family transcriptional regulator [Oscillospiraceae bacterium]
METQMIPESQKSRRIEQAVEISAQMFLKQGIDAVKMTDIADACGVGVATLYRYFGTKTSITIAAMTHLWSDLKHRYDQVFETDAFKKQSGIKRLNDLMRMYLVLFDSHGDFMRLVGEFDLMLQSENVPKDALRDYEQSIINFYPYIEAAYLAGLRDGTVRGDIDFKLFYLTYGHSMLELCKKLLRGELLPSDDFSSAKDELTMLADIGISFLRKEQEGT